MVLPVIPATSTARIMVRANANIFYDISNQNFNVTAAPDQVALNAWVMLDGPYSSNTGLMNDALRTAGVIPPTEPYTAMGLPQVGGGGETVSGSVLAVTRPDAIVDWVRLELRSAANSSVIVATHQALIQRDGDIVDVNGTGAVSFSNVPSGNYRVVVRHRNHIPVITAGSFALGSTPTTIDLTLAAIPLTHGAAARKSIAGTIPTLALWGGNASGDDKLTYYGTNSDRQIILGAVGSAVPFTELINVYSASDVNMDGVVRYYGTNADRQFVLLNVGSSTPFEQLDLPLE